MSEFDKIVDVFFDRFKNLLFPGTWLNLDLKFSKSEIFSMLLIDKRKEITMTELAEYLNAPMSTANGIVNRLVEKGHVSRERGELDRRIVVLHLTASGQEFINELKELVSGYLKIIMDDLSEEEKQFLIKIAMRTINNLNNKFNNGDTVSLDMHIKNIEIE